MGFSKLYPRGLRIPEVVVQLQIEPRGHTVAQHPGNERAWVEQAVRERQQDLGPPARIVLFDSPNAHGARPPVVGLAEHELDRVARVQGGGQLRRMRRPGSPDAGVLPSTMRIGSRPRCCSRSP
jgi:hypothetical protein